MRNKSSNNYLIAILIISFLFIFLNLGNRTISGDESLTTVVSQTILENGYPSALYDNNQLIIAKEGAYANVFGKEVYAWNPWMQEYITALSLKLFGMNEFMLRFPFALFGFLTIILFYFFAKKLTNNNEISLLSTLILATSVPFLLHIRQVRWYPLVMFFSLALLYSYLMLLKKEKNALLYFTLSSIFLFHSNFFIFVSLFLGLAMHFIFFFKEENKKDKIKIMRSVIIPLLVVLLFTAPWFYLTQMSKATYLKLNLMASIVNLLISIYYIFIYMFPFIFLCAIPFVLKKTDKLKDIKKSYLLIFIVIITYLIILSLKIDALPGMRSLIFLMPLFSLLSGIIIYGIKEKRKLIAYLLLILLILTNFLHIFPFIFFKGIALNTMNSFYGADSPSYNKLSLYEKQNFINNTLKTRYFFFDHIYEITHNYESSDKLIVDYMKKEGNKNDTFIASSSQNTILIYTAMERTDFNASNFDKDKIDWIIIRGFKVRGDKEEKFVDLVNEKINLSNYENITINSLEERWADAPDPANHRFNTDKSGTITIYHLKK